MALVACLPAGAVTVGKGLFGHWAVQQQQQQQGWGFPWDFLSVFERKRERAECSMTFDISLTQQSFPPMT
jgi:hypothetical protein